MCALTPMPHHVSLLATTLFFNFPDQARYEFVTLASITPTWAQRNPRLGSTGSLITLCPLPSKFAGFSIHNDDHRTYMVNDATVTTHGTNRAIVRVTIAPIYPLRAFDASLTTAKPTAFADYTWEESVRRDIGTRAVAALDHLEPERTRQGFIATLAAAAGGSPTGKVDIDSTVATKVTATQLLSGNLNRTWMDYFAEFVDAWGAKHVPIAPGPKAHDVTFRAASSEWSIPTITCGTVIAPKDVCQPPPLNEFVFTARRLRVTTGKLPERAAICRKAPNTNGSYDLKSVNFKSLKKNLEDPNREVKRDTADVDAYDIGDVKLWGPPMIASEQGLL